MSGKNFTLAEIEGCVEDMERRGIVERCGIGIGPGGKPAVMWRHKQTPEALAAREALHVEIKRSLAAEDKWVLEVRHGVALMFNRRTGRPDGWYWGDDEMPLTYGPFESCYAAIDDAVMFSDEPIKVNRHDDTDLGMGEEDALPQHTNGFVTVNVVDTDGQVWFCPAKGETPVAAE